MDSEKELRSIQDQLAAIQGRSDGVRLAQGDGSKAQRLVTDAKAAIVETLGDDHDYVGYLKQTVDRTMYRGATPEHVDDALEFIGGALTQLRRRRLREAGSDEIPASDRYVSISDNQRAALEDDLNALQNEARGANDVDEEDRLIALSEIAAFEATIVQPRVATELIKRFVDMVLAWIQRTFTTAAVQEVAQRLIQALLKLIT